MLMYNHDGVRQHNDQYHCHVCGKQWDVKDSTPPECLSPNERGAVWVLRMRQQLEATGFQARECKVVCDTRELLGWERHADMIEDGKYKLEVIVRRVPK